MTDHLEARITVPVGDFGTVTLVLDLDPSRLSPEDSDMVAALVLRTLAFVWPHFVDETEDEEPGPGEPDETGDGADDSELGGEEDTGEDTFVSPPLTAHLDRRIAQADGTTKPAAPAPPAGRTQGPTTPTPAGSVPRSHSPVRLVTEASRGLQQVTTAEIREATGLTTTQVAAAIQHLRGQGLMRILSRGVYQLVERAKEDKPPPGGSTTGKPPACPYCFKTYDAGDGTTQERRDGLTGHLCSAPECREEHMRRCRDGEDCPHAEAHQLAARSS